MGCHSIATQGRSASQLGDTVYQAGYLGPEVGLQVGQSHPPILDGVVEEGCGQGVGVQTELGQNQGRLHGVLQEGCTGQARLALVDTGGKVVRPGHHLQFLTGQIGGSLCQVLGETGGVEHAG